tara:strand:+ start:1244 stop:1495 length:252 start_codon:yes stop_codon:yes gene_type:complete
MIHSFICSGAEFPRESRYLQAIHGFAAYIHHVALAYTQRGDINVVAVGFTTWRWPIKDDRPIGGIQHPDAPAPEVVKVEKEQA